MPTTALSVFMDTVVFFFVHKKLGSGEILNYASEETGGLNQRLTARQRYQTIL